MKSFSLMALGLGLMLVTSVAQLNAHDGARKGRGKTTADVTSVDGTPEASEPAKRQRGAVPIGGPGQGQGGPGAGNGRSGRGAAPAGGPGRGKGSPGAGRGKGRRGGEAGRSGGRGRRQRGRGTPRTF